MIEPPDDSRLLEGSMSCFRVCVVCMVFIPFVLSSTVLSRGAGCIFIEMLQGAPAFPGVADVFEQLQKIWAVSLFYLSVFPLLCIYEKGLDHGYNLSMPVSSYFFAMFT